jgi:SAM-dependent methyltransferase
MTSGFKVLFPVPRAALVAAALAVAAAFPVCAQMGPPIAPDAVTPEIENKSDSFDVPFVPSHDNVLKAMFDMAKPTATDYVVDLGSGDGRIVIAAALDHGAQGFGVDLNEGLVRIANLRAGKAGVADRARFFVRNLFETDISRASVLTMYLLPEVVQELRPKILSELQPGSRVVSHDYHMAEWRPDETRLVELSPDQQEAVVYFWTVPAKVAGRWEWSLSHPPYFDDERIGYGAILQQAYQDFDGRVEINLSDNRLIEPKLTGRRISFATVGELKERMVRHDFEGVVEGDRITGTVRLSGGFPAVTLPWSAQRTGTAD